MLINSVSNVPQSDIFSEELTYQSSTGADEMHEALQWPGTVSCPDFDLSLWKQHCLEVYAVLIASSFYREAAHGYCMTSTV